MKVERPPELARERGRQDTAKHFSGKVWRDDVAPMDGPTPGWSPNPLRMAIVRFEATARTDWHYHEGGQVLVVVRGRGFVEAAFKLASIDVGDVVLAAPGECHRHGASGDAELVHVAVNAGRTRWSERAPDTVDQSTIMDPCPPCPAPSGLHVLRRHAELLDQAISWTAADRSYDDAARALASAMTSGDLEAVRQAKVEYERLLRELESGITLRDDLDPHALEPDDLAELRTKGSIDLAEEALLQGRMRERRILIEARQAETNRRLAWIAVLAAFAALSVPIIDRLLRFLLP
jgi:quercetin dioxygenase-like cupin family protein